MAGELSVASAIIALNTPYLAVATLAQVGRCRAYSEPECLIQQRRPSE